MLNFIVSIFRSPALDEKQVMAYELKQAHAEAVKQDARHRQRIHWDLEAADARQALVLAGKAGAA